MKKFELKNSLSFNSEVGEREEKMKKYIDAVNSEYNYLRIQNEDLCNLITLIEALCNTNNPVAPIAIKTLIEKFLPKERR